MARPPIDAALLPELLVYDPETGALTWKERGPEWFMNDLRVASWNSRHAGKPAFTARHRAGYAVGEVLGRQYLAHRVCWAIATGKWPVAEIDHINGIRSDNRLSNLREATSSENKQNRAASSGSSSRYVGVCWNRKSEKWQAQIRIEGRLTYLGIFDAEEDAFAAYCAAKAEHHTFNPVPREVRNGTV